jgi:hypothetical protein
MIIRKQSDNSMLNVIIRLNQMNRQVNILIRPNADGKDTKKEKMNIIFSVSTVRAIFIYVIGEAASPIICS